ncbi:hypothetical protein GCM10010517_60260 [Streptosporangium fragile]|uniref:Uncharacterized protein n=1 Tax=Streptosporangium fragile TaxID=46186 RepID=A0ABP6ILH3_9ACTN
MVAGELVGRLAGARVGAHRLDGLRLPVGQRVVHDQVLTRHGVARPVDRSRALRGRGAPPRDEHVVRAVGGNRAGFLRRRPGVGGRPGVGSRLGVLRGLGVVLGAGPGVLAGAGILAVGLVLGVGGGLLAHLVVVLPAGLDEALVEGVHQASHIAHGHAETGGAHLAPPQAQHQGALVPGDPEHPLLATLVKEHLAE